MELAPQGPRRPGGARLAEDGLRQSSRRLPRHQRRQVRLRRDGVHRSELPHLRSAVRRATVDEILGPPVHRLPVAHNGGTRLVLEFDGNHDDDLSETEKRMLDHIDDVRLMLSLGKISPARAMALLSPDGFLVGVSAMVGK